MSGFVVNANFPLNAGAVLLGEKYSELLLDPLRNLGVEPVPVPDNPSVDKRLSGHVDLSVFHNGGNKLILAPFLAGSELERQLAAYGFELVFADILQGDKYPHDAQLNAVRIAERLIYSNRTTYRGISDYAKDTVKLLTVRQGYARCSVCPVNDNSIITADTGIASVCKADGMDVLQIQEGFFTLEGYEYGFIGGSSFKLSEEKLAFTGRIDGHPDFERMMEFLSARCVKPVFLTELTAFDIGGAIPVTEK